MTDDTASGSAATPSAAGAHVAGTVAAAHEGTDAGNAVVEFVYLAVMLMVPIVYLMLGVFDVQRASFAVTEAARQAGRTYVTSGCDPGRAQRAADLALGDQGLDSSRVQGLVCPAPGEAVTVQVRYLVRLRGIGALLPAERGGVPVTGQFVAVRDRFAGDESGPAAARGQA